ncbi:hypothetical protein HBH67_122370 [Parastagonospora nodorum]|nr:hypothetical protein HBH67_122370 [Parastagonospora nodorum]KAH4788168.1 hypothetical protein HBH62_054160 [Parastagonospora nodorum]KAH4835157.1 hypothetical protein HBH63_017060 [Parastagonospora nodorum]
MTSTHRPLRELGARYSLLNLSVYDLVEEFARHSVYAVFKCLASSSNLSITTRCRASSLIYTKQAYLCADKYSKKHLKVREADALKQVDANVREEENKNCSSLYYSDNSPLDSDDYCLDSSLDINSKDDLEDEEATTAKDLKNEVVAIDPANSILCDLSDLLVVRFCIFSDPALENIGILTNKKVVEMQTDTATALANKLAAVNKLIILEANTPAVYPKATKHRLAPLAARFVIVCSFRKVDKHVFRAYNTISVTAQRMIIRKGSPYIEKRAILLPSYITFNATDKRDSVTGDRIYKIEDARNIIANIKHDASEHESSYKDILEKEGLNKLEASRRAAQFKIYSSCKVKRFTLNSVKDLFTNLSKDYFLVREARAITKSSLNIIAEDAAKAANILLLLKEVCAKILIESYKLIVQAIIVALIAFAEAIILTEAMHVVIIEPQDSELELKVLGKQDVKTTS